MIRDGVLHIRVYGTPAPQGSKTARSFCGQVAQVCKNCHRPHLVKINQVEASKHVALWRDTVHLHARQAMGRVPLRWDEPCVVSMVFTFTRPPSHYLTGRLTAGRLTAAAPLVPGVKPDLSKLVRSTEDALTTAGVWRDDALAVEYGRMAKVYVGEDRHALPRPGVRIIVTRWAQFALGAEQPTLEEA